MITRQTPARLAALAGIMTMATLPALAQSSVPVPKPVQRATPAAVPALPPPGVPAPPRSNCKNTAAFEPWLSAFKQEASAKGITAATLQLAAPTMTFDPGIVSRDRHQNFFAQSFLDFSGKLATNGRVSSSQNQIKKNTAIFARADQQWGVPAAVITAFWALESDFGSGMGKLPVLRSLTTLAYDCRRGDMFRAELLDALRIIDRGDLVPAEMIGSWAGELGQTQFLPSHYFKHAIDYDGDGRRNLMRSPPDIIASTSAFITSLGWQKGQPWLEEVRLPASMAWEQADLQTQHPRSHWAKAGITKANGQPLPADAQPASLLILMGRTGPAFLAYPNFRIFTEWNQSLNYATTAAYLATRIAGAPQMSRGTGVVTPLTFEQIKELQTLLDRAGYKQAEIDGKLGYATRGATRQAQLKLGLPADSYPTLELIERLKRR
jgi:lytic murein transglycosylase